LKITNYMKEELTKEELINLVNLLNRVDIKGSESVPFAVLLQKIVRMTEASKTPTPPTGLMGIGQDKTNIKPIKPIKELKSKGNK